MEVEIFESTGFLLASGIQSAVRDALEDPDAGVVSGILNN